MAVDDLGGLDELLNADDNDLLSEAALLSSVLEDIDVSHGLDRVFDSIASSTTLWSRLNRNRINSTWTVRPSGAFCSKKIAFKTSSKRSSFNPIKCYCSSNHNIFSP